MHAYRITRQISHAISFGTFHARATSTHAMRARANSNSLRNSIAFRSLGFLLPERARDGWPTGHSCSTYVFPCSYSVIMASYHIFSFGAQRRIGRPTSAAVHARGAPTRAARGITCIAETRRRTVSLEQEAMHRVWGLTSSGTFFCARCCASCKRGCPTPYGRHPLGAVLRTLSLALPQT